jgi:hypothetical protein
MTTSAIIMMTIAISLTWGGAALCIAIALAEHNANN